MQSICKGRRYKVKQLKRGRPTLQGKGMKKNFNNATEALNFSAKVRETIENTRTRSAWDRGVQAYALELLDDYDEYVRYEANEGADIPDLDKRTILNGAGDWIQYSYGGSSLIYNTDIAKRLCSPSELKRCDNGLNDPNSRETWCDIQARALFQAYRLILNA